jgi:hypothetical protein
MAHLNRATEYKSQFSSAVKNSAAVAPSAKFHLRRPPNDFIPATVVAIPTAYTHQHPKPSSYSRSVYSVLNTPNVSTVYGDDTTRTRSAKATVDRSKSTASLAREKRALEQSMEVVAARNRELELQLLDLKRELTMVKASSSLRQRSSSTRRRTNSSSRRLDDKPQATFPIGSSSLGPASARRPENLEKTLVLLESLRSAILTRQAESDKLQYGSSRNHQTAADPASFRQGYATERRQKKKKKKQRGFGGEETDLLHVTGATNTSSILPQQSVSIPTAGVSRSHVDPCYGAAGDSCPVDDSGASFETIQKNYWLHSRSMLSQLDRMLADAIHTRRN